MKESVFGLNKYIDHTNLKAFATGADIEKLCDEAVRYGFMSVCANPCYVPLVKKLLAGSGVLTCTVIGFPLGANSASIKAAEATQAYGEGCDEFDMVINIGALKDGKHGYVRDEISAVLDAVNGRTVKVIIETGLLTDSEKETAVRICCDAGAHFVKTCTGVSPGVATVEDIALMKRVIQDCGMADKVRIKASSGIKTRESALALINADAVRLGTSSGIEIVG